MAIKGLKHEPGIAAKLFTAIADKGINVELILQSIGRKDSKDISFVVKKSDADAAVETLKETFEEDSYKEIVSDKNVGIVSIVGAGMMSNSGAASKMFEALYNKGVNIHMIRDQDHSPDQRKPCGNSCGSVKGTIPRLTYKYNRRTQRCSILTK